MEEDVGEKVISMLKEIEVKLESKLKQKSFISEGKKNSHIHLLIETNLKKKLTKEAEEKCISISELYRQKLRDNSQLERIEGKIDKVLKMVVKKNSKK